MRGPACAVALALALLSPRVARGARDDDAPTGESRVVSHLPRTAAALRAAHACGGAAVGADGPAFLRGVLAARHVAAGDWEVDGAGPDAYARVFDLLDRARRDDVRPVPADVDDICHKGMGAAEAAVAAGGTATTAAVPVPPRPTARLAPDAWARLWAECGAQLASPRRIASACLDVPGVLVANPAPPLAANNPCEREYRMVDGAHRLCLRKYLVALLEGELAALEEGGSARRPDDGGDRDRDRDRAARIRRTQEARDRARRGTYLVLDPATFRSLLRDDDPRATWARDAATVAADATDEVRRGWAAWMGRGREDAAAAREEAAGDDEL